MVMHDCIVVGAGIHGLCTAFWLQQRGLRRLAVLERHGPGHAHGSSHGATRITRSSYDDPQFVALARLAHAEGWPALERALGGSLREATPGLFFGPAPGPITAWRDATAAAGAPVAPLAVAAARERFPLLRFADDDLVLLDRSAAMVRAADTLAGLRTWLTDHGVALRFATPVVALRPAGAGIEVATATATLAARHVVLACGPWSGRLHPAPAPLTVLRQEIGYVMPDAAAAALLPGAFPVWARIGHGADDFSYGLPSWAGSGLKVAWHRTTGAGVDPDVPPPPVDRDALLALARSRLTTNVADLAATETCLYTMAPAHALLVHRAAHAPVTTIAACSGHAFKFGPEIGRRAAAAVLGVAG